ncbi:MAG: hypothetical protein AAGC92_00485 [Pseudomonadota bacterium]
MIGRAPRIVAAARRICLTEISVVALVCASLAVSAVLWAAILAVL